MIRRALPSRAYVRRRLVRSFSSCSTPTGPDIAMRGAKIMLLHLPDGSMRVRYKTATRNTRKSNPRPGQAPLKMKKSSTPASPPSWLHAETTAQPPSLQGRR